MSEKKLRFLFLIMFMTAAIAPSGCRSSGVSLKPAMPSGNATSPQAALLPLFSQSLTASTTVAEPDGFAEYGNEPWPSGGSAISIDIDTPATRTTQDPNLPTSDSGTGPDAASDEKLAVREDSLLAGGITPSGTRPGGQRLAERPRNNPEAADLLDHWGYRRSQAIKEGLSLTPPLSGSDTFDLQATRSVAQRRSQTPIATNLQDGDEVQIIGTRRGVTFGRWAGEPADKPETYGLAGWTDYAAFTVSVSRDLQMALADPQPRYGNGSSRWNTLDVADLLQAEVDAFGYLSTRNFRSSHAAKGLGGTVRYAGGLLGAALDRAGLPPVTGDTSLAVDLATLSGAASFTSLTVYPDGTPEIFAGGSLHYPIELSANKIVGTGPGTTLQANFYGPKHEDVAGVLHDPRAGLLASFGATLDERPSREDVIASADYSVGLSYQRNTLNPANDGWYLYRCGTNSTCEARDDEAGRWNEWATTTRESVLASTAGWTLRNAARPEADYGYVLLERLTSASTDGARGRHVIDGYTGTMEHVAFGTGFERYSDWTTEPDVISPDFEHRWTGVQGTLSGSFPSGSTRWSGLMVGYQSSYDWGENPFVEGRATVDFSLSTNLVGRDVFRSGEPGR